VGTSQSQVSFSAYLHSFSLTNIHRPQSKEELFNLRHAQARNVVERIFGVLKRRFKVLVYPPEYDMDIQAQLPPALAAIHNFIRQYDPGEISDIVKEVTDVQPGGRHGELAVGPPERAARDRASARRDAIAQAMWEQYQRVVQERSLGLSLDDDV
jgi:hypothetical protein